MGSRGRRISIGVLGLGLAAGLQGCVTAPDVRPPAPPQVDRYTREPLAPQTDAPQTDAQRFVEGADVPGRWWTAFRSPALDALVDTAVRNSADVQGALAAVRAARETAAADRGALLPQVDAGYTVVRQKVAAPLASALANNAELYTLHTAQLTVGYTPDVFGGLRSQAQSSRAQADAQRYQAEAVYLTLTSNLVAAVVQRASVAAQIDQTRALIAAERKALELMRDQARQGEIGTADVAGEVTLVAQGEQTLPPLERQLGQQDDLIAALSGRTASEVSEAPIALADLTLPLDLPVSLPSKLAAQRPDVRAAEANVQAAGGQLGVAMAARLPTFPLTASLGGASGDLPTLFSNGDDFWTLGAEIAQPVFHGGSLRHRQRAAEAALEQSKAQYRSTLLTAFQNVADALQAIDADARAMKAAAAAEQGAANSLGLSRQQAALGQASTLAALSAAQAHDQALLAVTQAQAARMSDTAALFQALGGGWWNRDDVPEVQAAAASRGRE